MGSGPHERDAWTCYRVRRRGVLIGGSRPAVPFSGRGCREGEASSYRGPWTGLMGVTSRTGCCGAVVSVQVNASQALSWNS